MAAVTYQKSSLIEPSQESIFNYVPIDYPWAKHFFPGGVHSGNVNQC